MVDSLNWAEVIRNKSLKKTNFRMWLLDFLSVKNSPQSVTDLMESSQNQGFKINKTTFYRELSQLVEVKLIEELDFSEGKKRYELTYQKQHHHHLICENCKNISCLKHEPDLSEIETEIEQENDFKISHHHLEFFGICKKCNPA